MSAPRFTMEQLAAFAAANMNRDVVMHAEREAGADEIEVPENLFPMEKIVHLTRMWREVGGAVKALELEERRDHLEYLFALVTGQGQSDDEYRALVNERADTLTVTRLRLWDARARGQRIIAKIEEVAESLGGLRREWAGGGPREWGGPSQWGMPSAPRDGTG